MISMLAYPTQCVQLLHFGVDQLVSSFYNFLELFFHCSSCLFNHERHRKIPKWGAGATGCGIFALLKDVLFSVFTIGNH
jgi:hypothetical protein